MESGRSKKKNMFTGQSRQQGDKEPTFIPHGGDVVEPFFDSGDSMWRVLVPPPGYFGYSCHRAFEGPTGFGHHGVVTEMEIQCLDNIGGIIFGT